VVGVKATALESTTPSPLIGDITGPDGTPDGKVDIYDYIQLVSDFGKKGIPELIKSDIDANGKVDIFDYNLLVTNYGKSI